MRTFWWLLIVTFAVAVAWKEGRGAAYDARAAVHAAQNETKLQAELLQQCRTQ